MRVLVGCERSGVVREAFRRRGHDAWSCDLVPSDDESPYHFRRDIRNLIDRRHYWDLFIAHPECRFLSNSGVLRLYLNGKKANGRDEARWASMREAASFFKTLLESPIQRICIENPVMHGYAKELIGGVRQSQIIQPHQFGDDASKSTCLWLKNLPPLIPTKDCAPRLENGKPRWGNQTDSGQNRLGPSPERPALRAKTYPGIADAMAEQWG